MRLILSTRDGLPLSDFFSRQLRGYRQNAGLSQEALAARSGLSTVTISRIECGKTSPYLSTALELAAGLGVSISQLLSGSAYSHPAADYSIQNFHHCVRRYRLVRDWSQRELAARLVDGDPNQVSAVERNEASDVYLSTLGEYADAFGVEPTDLSVRHEPIEQAASPSVQQGIGDDMESRQKPRKI